MSGAENRLWRNPSLGRLINKLKPELSELPVDSFESRLITAATKERQRALRVPTALRREMAQAYGDGLGVWERAREQNNFELARPALERNIALARRYAARFPELQHPGDAFLDISDPGISVQELIPLFGQLRAGLLVLLKKVQARPVPDDSFFRQLFGQSAELAFSTEVVTQIGYDFERGRLDLATHPFMIPLGKRDVRITTRIFPNDFAEAFTSAVHEAGHAMYEQGIDVELDGTILGRGASDGVHESQSRLWENIVARQPAFWDHFFPRLQAAFPGQFDDVSKEQVVQALQRVTPSLIRASADEVTYNLHAIMRFEFETGLLDGSIKLEDLPRLWRERMKQDLGIDVPSDAEGVLQDPHWFDTGLMLFQGYALGNIMSAIFYEAALRHDPQIPQAMARGDFAPLRRFLTENIYRHGAKFSTRELLARVTGQPLQAQSLLTYLNNRYNPSGDAA